MHYGGCAAFCNTMQMMIWLLYAIQFGGEGLRARSRPQLLELLREKLSRLKGLWNGGMQLLNKNDLRGVRYNRTH